MADFWKLEDIVAYFTDDPEIAESLTDADKDRFSNPDAAFINLLQNALQYQGFDPKTILRQMVRRNAQYHRDHKEENKWDLSNINDDFKWTVNSVPANAFTNHESVTKDAHMLIFTFLLRCNHIGKIIDKSLPGVKDILEMLRMKYDINDDVRASGTSLSANDITLPRVAGTMPTVAVKLFHQRSVKETVQYLSIPGVQYEEQQGESSGSPSTSGPTIKTRKITHAICCPFLPLLHPMTSLGLHSYYKTK